MPTCYLDACPNEATVHLMLNRGGHHSSLLACPEHIDQARTNCTLLSLHNAEPVCGQPGSLWLLNDRGNNECGPPPATTRTTRFVP